MRAPWIGAVIMLGLAGCYVEPAPRPRPRIVEREVVDPYGNVVQRDTIIDDGGPPPPDRVEVIGVAPYPNAVWVRGYYVRDRYRHRWGWRPGYWR